MRHLFFLILFFVSACTGSPEPPASREPITFDSPRSNEVVEAGSLIPVVLSVDPAQEFVAVTLSVNGRLVRLVNTEQSLWRVDPLDSGLLTFLPGEHKLTAKVEAKDGSIHSRTITIHAAPITPLVPLVPSDFRITEVLMMDADSDRVYEKFNSFHEKSIAATVPIDAIPAGDLKFKIFYEGDLKFKKFYARLCFFDALECIRNGLEVLLNEKNYMEVIVRHENIFSGATNSLLLDYESTSGGDVVFKDLLFEIRFRVVESKVTVKTRTLNLSQSIGSNLPMTAEIVIDNLGEKSGDYEFHNIPKWLTLTTLKGRLEPLSTVKVVAVAQACTEPLADTAVIQVLAEGVYTDILVERDCVNGPFVDLALDRVYFNQSIPVNDSLATSEGHDIELVKGRKGIVRAFVTTTDAADRRLPQVMLYYRTASGQEGSYALTGPKSVPKTIYEGLLEYTFNVDLPTSFFAFGTEYYVVLDPGNQITERFENNNRYPREGYIPLKIRDVPPLKLTFIPMVKSGSAKVPKLTEDDIPVLMQSTLALMPLEDYDISIRQQPFVYTRKTWGGVLGELEVLHNTDRSEALYYGVVPELITTEDIGGLASLGQNTAIGLADPDIIAHELGHNFGLRHVDCGYPEYLDLKYPHENGEINLWGYNILSGFLKSPGHKDFMSYCGPAWISAYHYRKLLSWRGGDLYPNVIAAQKPALESFNDGEQELLIISGTLDGEVANVEHVYRARGVAQLNGATDLYTLILFGADGSDIYRGQFDITPVSHGVQTLFSAKIPGRQITKDIARIRIERNGTVYLDEPWQESPEVSLERLPLGTTAVAIDSDRIRIQWKADDMTSLWVKDIQTDNILAIDTTGEVIVYSQSRLLELKYTHQGREKTTLVEVE
jgi:hypothetical protein